MNTQKDENGRVSFSFTRCIMEYIFWGVCGYIIYYNSIFISVDNFTEKESKMILAFLMVAFSVAGFLLRYRKCITTRNIAADLLTGIGIYTILSCKAYYKKWFTVIIIAICSCVIFYVNIVLEKEKAEETEFGLKRVHQSISAIKKNFLKIFNVSSLCACILVLVMLVPVGYNRFVNQGIMAADTEKYTSNADLNFRKYDRGIEASLDIIEKIRENARWKPLSIKEKMRVLQTICNCEVEYLGLDCRVKVVIDELDEKVMAQYNDRKKTVVFNRKHLEEKDATLS